MGVKYGTVDGVKAKAQYFASSFNPNDAATNSQISDILDQASDMARDILQSRYSLSTIDAAPPNAVIEFAEIVGAIILLSSWMQTGTANSTVDSAIKWLKKRKKHYEMMILSGNILDSSNNPLSTKPVVFASTTSGTTNLEDIYS